MNFKQISKDMFRTSITVLKFCLLWALIILLFLVVIYGINFLLPNIKNTLKILSISIPKAESQNIFETVLNNANFSIVYISVLFTLMGLIVTLMSVWGSNQLNKLGKCHQDYEDFRKISVLEAQLITAKIFFAQNNFAEAWDNIKNLPEDFWPL